MRTVNDMLDLFTSFNTEDLINEALAATETDFAIAQREQMLIGFNSDGTRIGTYRNPAYKAKKEAMNPLADGYVDLKLKGDFHREVFAIADDEGLRVGSNDRKSALLSEKYGDVIWTLSPISKAKYLDMALEPATITALIKKLK